MNCRIGSQIEAAHVPVQHAVACVDIDGFVARPREMCSKSGQVLFRGQRRDPQSVTAEADTVAARDGRFEAVPLDT
jgi:hypothetical protein